MQDKPTSRPTRKVGKSSQTTPATPKPSKKSSKKPAKKKVKKSAPKRKKKPAKPEVTKLEYEIAGKVATIKIAHKVIKLRKWGLAKRLQLGARVSLLMDQLQPFIPKEGEEPDPLLIVSVMGQLVDDIMYIIIESTDDTFITHSEGIEWIDDACGPDDLFALGKIIYDMNLKDPEALGKLNTGMTNLADKMGSLLN